MKRLAISLFAVSVAISCTATQDRTPTPPVVITNPNPVSPTVEPNIERPDDVFYQGPVLVQGPNEIPSVLGNEGFLDGMKCFRTGSPDSACMALCETYVGEDLTGCLLAVEVYQDARSFDAITPRPSE